MDYFTITEQGSRRVKLAQDYTSRMPILTFRLHNTATAVAAAGFADWTAFEMMQELMKRGFACVRRPASRKVPPYKQGGVKSFLVAKTVCDHYLRVLLMSDALFNLGLQEIYHFQASQYYRTLLAMREHPERLSSVLPRQSHSYYKLFKKLPRGAEQPEKMDLEVEMESEDLGGKKEQIKMKQKQKQNQKSGNNMK